MRWQRAYIQHLKQEGQTQPCPTFYACWGRLDQVVFSDPGKRQERLGALKIPKGLEVVAGAWQFSGVRVYTLWGFPKGLLQICSLKLRAEGSNV